MYDATYEQIQALQTKLELYGISKEQLNLDNYAGLTKRELNGIVNAAIDRHIKQNWKKEDH